MVCLGAVTLVACGSGIGGGGGAGDGYVAVQRPSSPAKAVAPTGDVELVPLESGSAAKGRAGQPGSESDGGSSRSGADTGSGTDAGTGSGGSGAGSSSAGTSGSSGAHDSGRTGPASGGGDGSGDTGGTADAGGAGGTGGTSNAGGGDGSSGAGATSGAGAPAGPAVLVVGEPAREPADKRWCEKVTVGFRNTGGTAVRSGTVTFGTHVIGALGIDWATVESVERLPVPIAPGSRTEKTWTVCVDAWRVPLGMHVETRDVSVRWE
ncbi:hypothetical protein ACFW9L_20920 [Streptomyces sp. NPDC059517]|uniref:hypothetical protein n=1 Tax=Streptomyces sp. NPDC059517 TaxID=3346855 RepID=UPI00369A90D4